MANEIFLSEPLPTHLFLRFSARGFLDFQTYRKGNTKNKIIFCEVQTGRKHQFSERIFQWNVAICCERHLCSFTNYIKCHVLGLAALYPHSQCKWRLIRYYTLCLFIVPWSGFKGPLWAKDSAVGWRQADLCLFTLSWYMALCKSLSEVLSLLLLWAAKLFGCRCPYQTQDSVCSADVFLYVIT